MDYLIGEIELFGYKKLPYGWFLCDGSTKSIQDYALLYSLIGTRFGGDGRTTFAVPNMLNDSPIEGMKYYICAIGLYPDFN